jgi:thiosulfate dehydrogenase [quinone] large subunit
MTDEKNYTKLQLIGLVLLRVLIGWHFLFEGIAKLMKPNWSAAGFLLESKWIFAGVFKWMAGDPTILSIINFLNIWGLIFIGLGLILGCFSKIASMAGIGLLLLYYLCNPPLIGLYYSLPSEGHYLIINKNLVEMAALFILILFPTSQILGFDRFISKWIKK